MRTVGHPTFSCDKHLTTAPFGTFASRRSTPTLINDLQRVRCQSTARYAESIPATYVKRTLRSGCVEEYQGAVVVQGDVKRGAAVIAGGDVVVLGRLLGEAHAGAYGDRSASITALDMDPMQLRIADVAAYSPKPLAPAAVAQSAHINLDDLTIQLVPASSHPAQPRALKSQPHMRYTAPALASLFTGAYIILIGLMLTCAPLTIFGLLFDTRHVTQGWIRVGGVLATLFGAYYGGAGYGDASGAGADGFYAATIAGRIYLCVAFCIIVARGEIALALLIPAVVNLWGAISMTFALQRRRMPN